MPLFEYVCSGCASMMEVLQSSSDDLLTTCEKCGGKLKKLVSAPSVQFKGTGWYVSDYPKSGSPEKKGETATGDSSAPTEGAKPAKPSEGAKAGETSSSADSSAAAGGEKPKS